MLEIATEPNMVVVFFSACQFWSIFRNRNFFAHPATGTIPDISSRHIKLSPSAAFGIPLAIA
jgi:hypothetical protein